MLKPPKLLTIFFLIALIGCKKNTVEEPITPFTNINTNSSFSWSVTKSVDINITGLPTTFNTAATVSIKVKNATDNLYVGLHRMSDNITTKIEVPTSLDSVQLQFGLIRKMYNINGVSSITMNYLPTIDADPE
jgi:hypothetical protein